MIVAVVGSGGKTSLIKKLAAQYRGEGKTVLVTTTTHMFIEADTLLTDDADEIIQLLRKNGYAMAGIPEGVKIKALSRKTFDAVSACADVVLVEADGSKQLPLKYPNSNEPVIPGKTDEIIVVCGLNAIGRKAKDVCHRLELVKACLGIDDDSVIAPAQIQKLVTDGYLKPLRAAYPNVKITVRPRHDGSLYQRAIAALMECGQDVALLREEWFCPQTQEPGMLCILTQKHGSALGEAGSMMFVGKDRVLGSIGGGEPESLAIRQAREHLSFAEREFALCNKGENGQDMICGGLAKVLFIPVS